MLSHNALLDDRNLSLIALPLHVYHAWYFSSCNFKPTYNTAKQVIVSLWAFSYASSISSTKSSIHIQCIEILNQFNMIYSHNNMNYYEVFFFIQTIVALYVSGCETD